MRGRGAIGLGFALAALAAMSLPALAAAPIEVVQLTEEERAIPPATLSSEQAAVVLMEVAGRFEERGELRAARLLYREVIDRYAETSQATIARERLTALEGRPDSGTSLPPVSTPSPGLETETASPPPVPPAVETPTGYRPRQSGGLDQSGRVAVIAYSTAMAAWVALAIPIYSQADGSEGYGLALLLGAPAGLVASIYATRDRQVTAAQADIYVLAGNMGLWHGLALGIINDWSGHEVAGSAALGGLLGTGAGALLVSPGRTRETAAALSGLAAPYGIWYGLVLSEMFRDDQDGSDPDDDSVLGAMLAGGDAALIAAAITMKDLTLSRERARLIAVSGAAGALVGGAMDLLFGVEERKPAWILVGVGTTVGLAAGTALTAGYDEKRGFDDPPRASFERRGPDLAILPLHLKPLAPAGPDTPRWRESLRTIGTRPGPGVGVTLLEASF